MTVLQRSGVAYVFLGHGEVVVGSCWPCVSEHCHCLTLEKEKNKRFGMPSTSLPPSPRTAGGGGWGGVTSQRRVVISLRGGRGVSDKLEGE